MANSNESNSGDRFKAFYAEWLVDQQALLDQLLVVSALPQETAEKEDVHERRRALIDQCVSHYQRYFQERNQIAGDDVFMVFSSPWLSSFERTYLWIAGFRPTLILLLVESGVGDDLSPEQSRRMEQLKADTIRLEREVSEAMATVQESVAAPPLVALVRRMGRAVDGEISAIDEAMGRLRAAMVGLLESADALRGWTMREAMELLRPAQAVKFLVAAAEFQFRLRTCGLQMDSNRDLRG